MPQFKHMSEEEGLAMPINQLYENLTGNQVAAKTQLTMSREQAAYFMWKHCSNSKTKTQEIYKLGSLAYLSSLLDKGEAMAKYYSVGTILCLMRFDKDIVEQFAGAGSGARNIKNLADLLLGEHDRSKRLAAECLKVLVDDAELAHKLTAAIPQMVRATRLREPRWANMDTVRATCAGIVACLAEMEELPESMSRREEATSYLPMLRGEGAVEAMLPLLHDANKTAQCHAARVIDAFLKDDLEGLGQMVLEAQPPPGTARAAAAAATANVVSGGGGVVLGGGGAGSFESAHLAAAAAAAEAAAGAGAGPGPGSEATGGGSKEHDDGARDGYDGLRTLVDIVRTGEPLGQAAAAGCIAQLCAVGKRVLHKLHALGGVPPLAALLVPPLADAGGKSKKKKPPPVPPEVRRGIVSASGALRLLSFEDYIKPDIVAAGAVPGLAKLVEMKGKKWNLDIDAYNNAVGCLYNLAQDRRNTEALEEAELPPHLVRPFPASWMCDPEVEDDEVDASGGPAVLVGLPGLKHLDADYGLPIAYDPDHHGDSRVA